MTGTYIPAGVDEGEGALAVWPGASASWGPVDRLGDLVEIGDYHLPRVFWGVIKPQDPQVPTIDVRVELNDRGSLVLTGVRMETEKGAGLAIDLNRSATLLRRAVRTLAALSARQAGGEGDTIRLAPIGAEQHEAFLRALDRHERTIARGGMPPGPERLKRVAEVYKAALSSDDPKERRSPTLQVMKAFHVGRSQASRWIREARDTPEVDLGQAAPRKAGG